MGDSTGSARGARDDRAQAASTGLASSCGMARGATSITSALSPHSGVAPVSHSVDRVRSHRGMCGCLHGQDGPELGTCQSAIRFSRRARHSCEGVADG